MCGGHYSTRVLSVGELFRLLAAISLQGKEKSSSLLTFLYCIERVVTAVIF